MKYVYLFGWKVLNALKIGIDELVSVKKMPKGPLTEPFLGIQDDPFHLVTAVHTYTSSLSRDYRIFTT